MNKLYSDQLPEAFQEDADILQVYEDWGESSFLGELLNALDYYQPDWYKEKELGSWAASFILDILADAEEESTEMDAKQRRKHLDDLLDERYEDFRSGHQFARINNINLTLQDGEDLDAVLAERDNKILFPILKGIPGYAK